MSEPRGPLVHFSCGILAGCLAGMVTQPADVVKTHMQLYPDRFQYLHTTAAYIYRVSDRFQCLHATAAYIYRVSDRFQYLHTTAAYIYRVSDRFQYLHTTAAYIYRVSDRFQYLHTIAAYVYRVSDRFCYAQAAYGLFISFLHNINFHLFSGLLSHLCTKTRIWCPVKSFYMVTLYM